MWKYRNKSELTMKQPSWRIIRPMFFQFVPKDQKISYGQQVALNAIYS